jgi:hypothetical protein
MAKPVTREDILADMEREIEAAVRRAVTRLANLDRGELPSEPDEGPVSPAP